MRFPKVLYNTRNMFVKIRYAEFMPLYVFRGTHCKILPPRCVGVFKKK